MSSRREKRGFTLIELVVAVGLLAMIFSFSGVIFKVSIESHRMAVANSEIMQKFRVITDQINADFKGIRKDAPMVIYFDRSAERRSIADPSVKPDCNDKMMLFADGDFGSVQQYHLASPRLPDIAGGVPIAGNVARIRYGLATQPDGMGIWHTPQDQARQDRLLARQQNILSADPELQPWPVAPPADVNTTYMASMPYPAGQENLCRQRFEHDNMALSQWQNLNIHTWNDTILARFVAEAPCVNLNDPTTFHKMWSEGVSSFKIEWSYRDFDPSGNIVLCWFPSDNPDEMGNFPSHFVLEPLLENVGVRFNFPFGAYWHKTWPIWQVNYNATQQFGARFFPDALRFTFTIHDSKGIYPEGRTFTHIVYLGD